MKCECGTAYKVLDFTKSDGTTNRPYDRVIAKCPSCKTVISTIYDPRDWWTHKQKRVIERMMRKKK